jgi:mRNA-degrading endonuclease RelE of RelBE toxin-antitoxin system
MNWSSQEVPLKSWKISLEVSAKRSNEISHKAFDTLRSNPYPTNTDVTTGTIARLSGTDKWRFRVSYSYRLRYSIRGQTVVIDRVRHRKDVYRR